MKKVYQSWLSNIEINPKVIYTENKTKDIYIMYFFLFIHDLIKNSLLY